MSALPWKHDSTPDPALWGLERRGGRLFMEEVDLVDLALGSGTPLYVASAARLRARARRFQRAFADYPATVSVYFPYKTNPVSGVLRVLHEEGLGAEVGTGYELYLAHRLGVPGADIVFGGGNKRDEELDLALEMRVGLVVADHLGELERLDWMARERGAEVPVALRICPELTADRGSHPSLTGSRKGPMGLDLPGGEVEAALKQVQRSPHLRLRGVMAHLGSGIHEVEAFGRMVEPLLDVQARAWAMGMEPDLLDLGGGLGARLARELSKVELAAYLGTGRLPAPSTPQPEDLVERYAAVVIAAVEQGCAARSLPLPRLVLEPGRILVSDAQLLLLRVGHVRERPGVGSFAVVDGGAMTVSTKLLLEQHAVLLANRQGAHLHRVHVHGSAPNPLDLVYRNLALPPLRPGDLLSVMDAGAYFTATATRFGGPRPGVVLVDGDAADWARRPETFDDLVRLELALD